MINEVVRDAMRRAGEKPPEDGIVHLAGGAVIACATTPTDLKMFFRNMNPDKYTDIRRNYLEAGDKLIGLENALSGVPELKAELAMVKAAYATLSKTKFGKYL